MNKNQYMIVYIYLNDPSLTCTLAGTGDIVQGSHAGGVTAWYTGHVFFRTAQHWIQDTQQ